MKRIVLLLLLPLVASCSMFKSRAYDPVEYDYAIQLATDATHAVHRCADANDEYYAYLQSLNHISFLLPEYIKNKADSKQALPSAVRVRQLTISFLQRHDRTAQYCTHKLSNIQAASRMLARSLGSAEGFDPCSDDVKARYALFEDSYKKKLISEDEFKELSGDLTDLSTINVSSCTLQHREQLEASVHAIQSAVGIITALPLP